MTPNLGHFSLQPGVVTVFLDYVFWGHQLNWCSLYSSYFNNFFSLLIRDPLFSANLLPYPSLLSFTGFQIDAEDLGMWLKLFLSRPSPYQVSPHSGLVCHIPFSLRTFASLLLLPRMLFLHFPSYLLPVFQIFNPDSLPDVGKYLWWSPWPGQSCGCSQSFVFLFMKPIVVGFSHVFVHGLSRFCFVFCILITSGTRPIIPYHHAWYYAHKQTFSKYVLTDRQKGIVLSIIREGSVGRATQSR